MYLSIFLSVFVIVSSILIYVGWIKGYVGPQVICMYSRLMTWVVDWRKLASLQQGFHIQARHPSTASHSLEILTRNTSSLQNFSHSLLLSTSCSTYFSRSFTHIFTSRAPHGRTIFAGFHICTFPMTFQNDKSFTHLHSILCLFSHFLLYLNRLCIPTTLISNFPVPRKAKKLKQASCTLCN